MHSPGITGEGELRGRLANPGSPGKMAVKTECVRVLYFLIIVYTDHIVLVSVYNVMYAVYADAKTTTKSLA